MSLIRRSHRKYFWVVAITAALGLFASNAKADTAAYNSSVNGDYAATGTQMDAIDGSGYTMAGGEILTIVSDTLFGTTAGDTVTLYHFSTTITSRFRVRLGYMDANGVIQFLSGNRNGTATLVNGVFNIPTSMINQCVAVGGCNFIQITARDAGYTLDGVAVNGSLLTAASAVAPTPEPATWMLMIVSFMLIAMRLKAERRRKKDDAKKMPGISSGHPAVLQPAF